MFFQLGKKGVHMVKNSALRVHVSKMRFWIANSEHTGVSWIKMKIFLQEMGYVLMPSTATALSLTADLYNLPLD